MSGSERPAIDYFYILSPCSITGFSLLLSVTKRLVGPFQQNIFCCLFLKRLIGDFLHWVYCCQMNGAFFNKVCHLQMAIGWLLKAIFLSILGKPGRNNKQSLLSQCSEGCGKSAGKFNLWQGLLCACVLMWAPDLNLSAGQSVSRYWWHSPYSFFVNLESLSCVS